MDTSLARLDLCEIFCDVDDFYQVLERAGEGIPRLPYDGEAKRYRSTLSISEVMTIMIAFHSILQFFAICRKILSWYTIARIGNVSQCSITVYQNLC
jgi:hypothetical protein